MAPVMWEASSEAKNRMEAACSSGSASRRSMEFCFSPAMDCAAAGSAPAAMASFCLAITYS